MQEKGYEVTGVKCSTKFQSMKRMYKVISDHNKKSGNNHKEWEYLQIMQELFADKPWIQPLSVAGSHVNETEEKENILKERGIKRKKKLNAFIEEYILNNEEERKRRRESREKEHKEKMLCFKGIQDVLQRLLEKEDKST
ncbi:hypothetical protein ALC57_13333 [Trachymyrmex cornetzi]|uniref:Myb/SANT-like DNA-binding domain-containing protein n=2 Tax=Trachymyrmex cornetzi TaxID=471704 RepID=A0A151IZH2_9HYME|nr:hypothetical protein ALC57_13333 [Trachymyrmex cornetzi]